jgi:hypothetical protein
MVASNTMVPGTPATAEGDFGRTPLAHLLVYAVDRRLTGALFLTESGGVTHVVRLVRGTPVKVRPGDDHALLGELLVEAGEISRATLENALLAKGRLGEVLMLSGSLRAETLDRMLEAQFMRRMVHLFTLPPDTIYRYYDAHCELVDWGGEPSSVDALAVIWAGVRAHADASSMMASVLARLADMPMRIHVNAPLARFQFSAEDNEVLELIQANAVSLADLVSYEAAPEELLRRLVYTLLITRQLDVGTGASPVGSEERQSRPTPTMGFSVGRLQLKSEVHRLGAAAPDPPGDGERAAVVPVRRRKKERPSIPSEMTAPPESSREPRSSRGNAPAGEAPPTVRQGRRGAVDPQDAAAGSPPNDSGAAAEQAELPVQPASSASSDGDPVVQSERPSGIVGEPPAAGGGLAGYDEPESGERPRFIDPSLPPATLLEMAEARIESKDIDGAFRCWQLAHQAGATHPDALALGVWIRSMQPGADVKPLMVEIDELLHDGAPLVKPRFVRGLLRRRLGDTVGAARDFERVIDLDPGHPGAVRELAALEDRQSKPTGGLLSRLFKR